MIFFLNLTAIPILLNQMKITFLGTGTSQGIPVIACRCYVCMSDDVHDKRLRVSVKVEVDGTTIVIDCGPDFRYQMLRSGTADLDAILFTHEHKDHVAGLDDIRPFNYLLGKNIDVFATLRVQEALRREFAYIFADSNYPGLPQLNLHTISADADFTAAGIRVTPIQVMHHELPVLGFRIGNFTYITDAKYISEKSMVKIKSTEVLVLNALQRTNHISHFTLDEAIDFAKQTGAKQTYFTHMSHNLGLHADISKELPEGIQLAYDGLEVSLVDPFVK